MRKITALLMHVFRMVRKNLRSYALLSLTVVLSFSGLLAYLMYTDSSLYNDYKEVLSRDSNVICVDDTSNDISREQALLDVLERENLGSYYVRQRISSRSAQYGDDHCVVNMVYAMPSYVWGLYEAGGTKPYEVTWLDGRKEPGISLGLNEVLIPRSLYIFLCLEKMDVSTYELWLQGKKNDSTETEIYFPVECRVVGLIEDGGTADWRMSDEKGKTAWFPVYICQSTAEEKSGDVQVSYNGRNLLLYTNKPAETEQKINQLGLACVSTYIQHREATRELQVHSQTKTMITLALFVLLTINLYGCFTNTLEYRKFEVGVKRAIGASKGAIMGQFLCEGILVMLCNLILSVFLVTNGFLIYKYWYQNAYDLVWTITLSGTSVGMFAGVSICLTLLFCGLFAYKSTQVEVVKHLKAE